MNRDTPPTGAAIAAAFGEIMVVGKHATEAHAAAGAAEAAVTVRGALAIMWRDVPPEAARDVMVTCAEMAVEVGFTGIPAGVLAQWDSLTLDGASGLLEMTRQWIADGRPRTGQFTPPEAFASSVAFDREEDQETLTSLAVLLALAHLPRPLFPEQGMEP